MRCGFVICTANIEKTNFELSFPRHSARFDNAKGCLEGGDAGWKVLNNDRYKVSTVINV